MDSRRAGKPRARTLSRANGRTPAQHRPCPRRPLRRPLVLRQRPDQRRRSRSGSGRGARYSRRHFRRLLPPCRCRCRLRARQSATLSAISSLVLPAYPRHGRSLPLSPVVSTATGRGVLTAAAVAAPCSQRASDKACTAPIAPTKVQTVLEATKRRPLPDNEPFWPLFCSSAAMLPAVRVTGRTLFRQAAPPSTKRTSAGEGAPCSMPFSPKPSSRMHQRVSRVDESQKARAPTRAAYQ